MADSNSYIQKANSVAGATRKSPVLGNTQPKDAWKKYYDLSTKLNLKTNPIPKAGVQPGMPGGAGYVDTLQPSTAATGNEDTQDLGAVGWLFRVASIMGRHILNNTMNTTIDIPARLNEIAKDGLQFEDLGSVGSLYLEKVGKFAATTAASAAYSFAPDSKKDLEKTFDVKLYDWWEDALKSDTWKKYVGSAPSTKTDGTVADWVPLLGGSEWSDASRQGLLMDMFLDPASYLTWGVGGLVKGLGRGVAATTRVASAVDKAAEIARPINRPRPFYDKKIKVEGKFLKTRAGNSLPLSDTVDTLVSTNPYRYILREMGRGFQESHANAAAAFASGKIAGAFNKMLDRKIEAEADNMLKGVTAIRDLEADDILRLGKDTTDELIEARRAKLQADGVTKDDLEAILAKEKQILDAEVAAAAKPKRVKRKNDTVGAQALKEIQDSAAAKGITAIEESVLRKADEAAARMAGPTRVFREARSEARLAAGEPLTRLGDQIIAGATREGGDAYSAWDAFVSDAVQVPHLKYADNLAQPIGFKQIKTRNVKNENVGSTGKGSESRKKGKGESTPTGNNAEYNALLEEQKVLSGNKKTPKPVWSQDNLQNDWKRIRKILGIEGDTKVPVDLSKLTGEALRAAGISPALLGARLRYAGSTASRRNKKFEDITNIGNLSYNPITARPEAVRSFNMVSNDAERELAKALKREAAPLERGRILGAMLDAAGVIRDINIVNILKRMGIKADSLDTIDGKLPLEQIAESVMATRAQKLLQAKERILRKIEKTELKLVINGKPTVLTAKNVANLDEKQVVEVLSTSMRRDRFLHQAVTDEELAQVTKHLDALRIRQLAAKELLRDIGADIDGFAKPIYQIVTRSYTTNMGELSRRKLDRVFDNGEGVTSDRLKAEFLGYAYRASQHKDSIEGGRFAAQIDELAEELGFVRPNTIKGTDQFKETIDLIAKAAGDRWTGHVNPALLHQTILRTRTAPAKAGKSLSAVGYKKQEERLIKHAEELIDELIEEGTKARVSLPGYRNGKIRQQYKAGKENNQSYKEVISYDDAIIKGTGVDAGQMFHPEYTVAIKAAEKTLKEVDYVAIDSQLAKDLERVTLGEGYVPLKMVDGKPVPAARNEPATHLRLPRRIVKALGADYRNLKGLEARLAEKMHSLRYEKAIDDGIKAQARHEAERAIPLELHLDSVKEFIKKNIRVTGTSIQRVEANMAARFWMAFDMRLAENLVDVELAKSPFSRLITKDLKGIRKSVNLKSSFEKLVVELEDAVAKQSPKLAKPEWDGEMSLEQILENGNPYLFTSWLRKKEILSATDKDEWASAMMHMRNFTTLVDGESPWRSYREMMDSYRPERNQRLVPGRINPKTGLPVPTEQQMTEVLAALGVEDAIKAVSAKQILERSDVMAMINGNRKYITELEMQQAQARDFFSTGLIAHEDAIRPIVDALPGGDATIQQAQQLLLETVTKLQQSGSGFVVDIGIASSARGLGMFTDMPAVVANQAGELARPVADFLSRDYYERLYRTVPDYENLPETTRKLFPKVNLKLNFGKENLYTADKEIFGRLSDMAEMQGLTGQARTDFIAENAELAIRVRDLYFNARGIYPSTTLNATGSTTRKTLIALGKNAEDLAKETRDTLMRHGVYITEGDFIDVLGKDVFASQFCIGRMDSLPLTTLFEPARLLIISMQGLPAGQWFNKAELAVLKSEMKSIMARELVDIPRGEGIPPLIKQHPDLTLKRIDEVIDHLLDESRANMLLDSHKINASYAMKKLQYDVAEVANPIREALTRMLSSELSSDGTNLAAVRKASEDLDKILKTELDDPQAELMAKMDHNVMLWSRLHPHQAILFNEAARASKTASEAASIKEVQSGVAQAGVEATQALEPILFGNKTLMEALDASAKGLSDDLQFEIGVQNFGDRQNILTELRNGSKLQKLGRAFSGEWNMGDVRNVATAVTMTTKAGSSEWAEIVARHVTKLDAEYRAFEAQTGRKLEKEAYAKLKEIPEEVIQKAYNAMDSLEKEAISKAEGIHLGIPRDEYARLLNEAQLLDAFIDPADTMLRQAVKDMWKIHKEIFGGGTDSFLYRNGMFDHSFLNSALRELGAGTASKVRIAIDRVTGDIIKDPDDARKAVKAGTAVYSQAASRDSYMFVASKDPNAFTEIWREWDLENPYDMYVQVNSALQKVIEAKSAASTLTSAFGIKASSITEEMAKEAGLVRITLVGGGRELDMLRYIPEGYYFPKDIAIQLREVSKYLSEVKHMQATGLLERSLIRVQTIQDFAKKAMTQYSVKNWVQNTVGGYFANGFYMGVWSPLAYARSIRVMQAVGKQIEDMGIDPKSLDGMIEKWKLRQGKQEININPATDPSTATSFPVRVGGKTYNVELKDWWDMYAKYCGIVPHTQSGGADLLREGAAVTGKVRKAKATTKADTGLAKIAGHRDDWLRLAGFIDGMLQGSWDNLEAGALHVAKRINKAHPQMQSLSTFHQVTTRNLVLFFSWRAQMLGTVIMGLLDKPGPVLNLMRVQNAESRAQGNEYSYFGDFTPNNKLVPGFKKDNLQFTATADSIIGQMIPGDADVSMTLSIPAQDLLGTGSWLQALRMNRYDPVGEQLASMAWNTFDNFVTSSSPLLFSATSDWLYNTSTGKGQKLISGGRFIENVFPAWAEDAMVKMGLGPVHSMFALAFPGTYLDKFSQMGKPKDKIQQQYQIEVMNWLTGLKATEMDTLELRQKAWSEILKMRQDRAQ